MKKSTFESLPLFESTYVKNPKIPRGTEGLVVLPNDEWTEIEVGRAFRRNIDGLVLYPVFENGEHRGNFAYEDIDYREKPEEPEFTPTPPPRFLSIAETKKELRKKKR